MRSKWMRLGLAMLALMSPFSRAESPSEVARALAPTGTLRAAINLGNPILARLDPTTGRPVGVSVDLAQALAQQFNLPLTLMPVDSAAKSVEAVTQGQADIGFFAIDPIRGKGIQFTPPYVLIEGSYLVKKDSALTDNAQVDQSQHRVVVGQGSAYDLYLTRALQHAQLVRAPTSPEVVRFFLEGGYEVAAGVKQQLEADARQTEGLRLLPGRFMVIEQAMGQSNQASPVAHEALKKFVTEMKSNGFIRERLDHHQIQGATVAP